MLQRALRSSTVGSMGVVPTFEASNMPYALTGLPMVARIHESAAGSFDKPALGALEDELLMGQPAWRNSLVVFCQRCAMHSRHHLRDKPAVTMSGLEVVYHTLLAGELDVGAACMTDQQLVCFAIFCLVGDTEGKQGPALLNTFELMEKQADAKLRTGYHLLLQPALDREWIQAGQAALGVSGAAASLKKMASHLTRVASKIAGLEAEYIGAASECIALLAKHFPALPSIAPAITADIDQVRGAEKITSALVAQFPSGASFAPRKAAGRQAVQSHIQAQSVLLAQAGGEYRLVFPALFDALYWRDFCQALAEHVGIQHERFREPYEGALVAAQTWFNALGHLVVHALTLVLQETSLPVENIATEQKALEAAVASIQGDAGVGTEIDNLFYQLSLIVEVTQDLGMVAGTHYDSGEWAKGVAELNRAQNMIQESRNADKLASVANYYKVAQQAVDAHGGIIVIDPASGLSTF
ncbi:MAG TPA: hypothetical protein PKX17_05170, partial [Candidatus Methanomethylicus sp.]|nr:hypothetical protein [Candidatus Methanomethylicus sp.]